MKNRKREFCTSGSVRGEGGNILTYSAARKRGGVAARGAGAAGGTGASPSMSGGWTHAALPVTREDRTELWHTRLGLVVGEQVDEKQRPVVRAIWARDFESDVPPKTHHKTRLLHCKSRSPFATTKGPDGASNLRFDAGTAL
jgi:hypothetical protein